ncbi:cold shock domain-containing protein [Streptacidiphilus sp. PAMC 29251]
MFVGEYLVGVVIEDPLTFSESLVARRIEDVVNHGRLAPALGGLNSRVVSAREPGLKDLHQLSLPLRPENFTGRTTEIETLARATGTVVITGAGGTGKTGLAAEYAHQRLSDSRSAVLVWWFNAANRVDLTAAMSAVYSELTGGHHARNTEVGAERLRNWLQHCRYNWLVVFDNADESQIADLCAESISGRTLITSRRGFWPRGFTVMKLDTLPDSDTRLLLERISDQPIGLGDNSLIASLGGFPLAIEQAGICMRRTGWDARRYADETRAMRTSPYARNLSTPEQTVARVIDSNLQQATRVPGGEKAADLMGVLAYLASDNIPARLLDQRAGRHLLGESLEEALALDALCEYSVATRSADNVRVHPVVQSLVVLRLEHAYVVPADSGDQDSAASRDQGQGLDAVYRHAAAAAALVTGLGEEIINRLPTSPAPDEGARHRELRIWYSHYTSVRGHLKRIADTQGQGIVAFTVAEEFLRVGSRVTRILFLVGTVKWFSPLKGFGFIECEGIDYFVHISAVERAGLSRLAEGQEVAFEVAREKGKTSAANIGIIDSSDREGQ